MEPVDCLLTDLFVLPKVVRVHSAAWNKWSGRCIFISAGDVCNLPDIGNPRLYSVYDVTRRHLNCSIRRGSSFLSI